MSTNLILIEGLPGSGKTTTAELVHEILSEMHMTTKLFLEGNLDHPADYDGVAFFNQHEFNQLLHNHKQVTELLWQYTVEQDQHYFLSYRKLQQKHGSDLPDELMTEIFKHDIYELSLEQNQKLITDKWRTFTRSIKDSKSVNTYIFDCCFIQNPVTIGMIKYGAERENVIGYVLELAAIVRDLNPLLIYVDQQPFEPSFRKAVQERPIAWSEGFIEYYTGQGYGKSQGFTGLEGTIEVLRARRELEEEIYSQVDIAKIQVNNSDFNREGYKEALTQILEQYLSLEK